jgi:nucleoside-diphosphate-sugar epimerase
VNIMITGINSYVGNHLRAWLSQWPERYHIQTLTLRNECWKETNFASFDVVVHVSAIVHKKIQSRCKDEYYRVNRDLTLEVANKAKQSGVKQFIFMSTMAVYGLEGKIGKDIVIDRNTLCRPITLYGKSKLEAENGLNQLSGNDFLVAIIRAPMIYGPDCPGNYTSLKKLQKYIPLFPNVENQRSMIFIGHLSQFLKQVIDMQGNGLFFPQNKEYVSTIDMVRSIAHVHSRDVFFSKMLAGVVRFAGKWSNYLNKIFGNLRYEMNMSAHYNHSYSNLGFEETIKRSERVITQREL